MKNLFIWYYIPRNLPKGVPLPLNCTLVENFNPSNPTPGFDYPWVRYNYHQMPFPPQDKGLQLPEHLFLVVKKEKELLFDFLTWKQEYKIVSESMLKFLKDNGLTDGYELSKITPVNTTGKSITTKTYYLLRFGQFDDEYIDFNESTKKRAVGTQGLFLYPDIHIKNTTSREIFVLKHFCYIESLLFSDRIKQEIQKRFYAPEIYSSLEYIQAFNERNKGI